VAGPGLALVVPVTMFVGYSEQETLVFCTPVGSFHADVTSTPVGATRARR
jgi:hypothetical protein